MRSTVNRNIFWPPKGWKSFESITNLSGQSVSKDPATGHLKGLIYKIDSMPIYYADTMYSAVHQVIISGWEYNILGESEEYPILSFFFQDRLDAEIEKERCMSLIKVKNHIFPITKSSAVRSHMAALFLIRQIESGNVLDVDRVLTLYKIHPSQKKIYHLKNFARNGFYSMGNMPFIRDDILRS